MPSRVAPGKTSLDSSSPHLALLPRACVTQAERNPTILFLFCPQEHSSAGGKIRPENCCYGLCFVEVEMLVQESDCLIALSLSLSLSPSLSPLQPPSFSLEFYCPNLACGDPGCNLSKRISVRNISQHAPSVF